MKPAAAARTAVAIPATARCPAVREYATLLVVRASRSNAADPIRNAKGNGMSAG
jgi:hypothetical protein